MTDVYTEADLYCAAFAWPVGAEVDWILDEVERLAGRRPSSVLEPMCGNARYGPAFAERGVRYVGFDREPTMLARAPRHEDVMVVKSDARSFAIDGAPFDLAWCPINSIRHLESHDDLAAHLRCVRDHLGDGGLYVVESDFVRWDGPWPRRPDEQSDWVEPQGDGSSVRARWWIERGELAKRCLTEGARFERLVNDQVVMNVECRYRMLMLSLDDWNEAVAASGFAIAQVVAHGAGERRAVVPPSRDLENNGVNYYLFLRTAEAPGPGSSPL